MIFRTALGEEIFHRRYAQGSDDTWPLLAKRLVQDVCDGLLTNEEKSELVEIITEMRFIPGGRYLYYAGRPAKFFNNCYAMGVDDTREGWGELTKNVTLALMCGGGVGVDYSELRPDGTVLHRTGGVASGPLPLMHAVNEVARNVMQGGSRRSAVWAGLNWQHKDINVFLTSKNWSQEVRTLKANDYNFPAPLDMTNISVLYDDAFLADNWGKSVPPTTFVHNIEQMMKTGEPGMCFNFFDHVRETLRNACTELITEYDSDVCNLGSINLGRIDSLTDLGRVVNLAAKFLVCGTLRAELPYEKVYEVRQAHRKIGVGLMGIHEWLLRRGYRYECTPELRDWLVTYRDVSKSSANELTDRLSVSQCERYQAVAPSGTISILAGTTSGCEPLFSVATKRRYLGSGTRWKHQYIIDPTAQWLMDEYGLKPEQIETAYALAEHPERRIAMQADIQEFVDMGISSTINLPEWGSPQNNYDKVLDMAHLVSKYAQRIRGITMYPNNARAGQVLTEVPYEEAFKKKGVVYDSDEHSCKGSICEL